MSEEPAVSSLSGSCTAARASVGSMSSSTSVALPTPPTNSCRPCTPREACQLPHFCSATTMVDCHLHQSRTKYSTATSSHWNTLSRILIEINVHQQETVAICCRCSSSEQHHWV